MDLAVGLPAVTKARSCLILGEKQHQQVRLPQAPQSLTCAEHMRCPAPSQAFARSVRPRAEGGLGWKPPHIFHVTEVLRGTRWGYSLPSLAVRVLPLIILFLSKCLIDIKLQKTLLLRNILLHRSCFEVRGIAMEAGVPRCDQCHQVLTPRRASCSGHRLPLHPHTLFLTGGNNIPWLKRVFGQVFPFWRYFR